jgi:tripartite-type tricarboxylate transporter receptor subunit TctC
MQATRHNADILLGFMLAGAAGAAYAQADAYPVKPLRMIVPFPPGGSTDLHARLLQPKFSELLGQQIIVDNRSGASGHIGTELAARSSADGYTIVMQSVPFVISPIVFGRAPYDAVNDFAPISQLSNLPMAVSVHPSVPARTVSELLALARAKPGALNYGSAGIGSNSHITGELFNLLGKTRMVAVHFKGGGPSLAALVGGEIHVGFSNIAETSRMVTAGRLRALAVSSAQRTSAMPDVPTNAEAGLPGFEFSGWHGVLAPKATPPRIVATLNEKLRSAVSSPGDIKRFEERGIEIATSTPEAFAAYLKNEVVKWTTVIRERNIKAE